MTVDEIATLKKIIQGELEAEREHTRRIVQEAIKASEERTREEIKSSEERVKTELTQAIRDAQNDTIETLSDLIHTGYNLHEERVKRIEEVLDLPPMKKN